MADIADVVDAIYGIVVSAACPTGLNNPGVTGKSISIGEGWAASADIDVAMASGTSIISIYVDPGNADPGQVLDRWETLSSPVHGMTATLSADQTTITLSGAPGSGEYVTAIMQNWKGYSFANPAGGGTAASMAVALAAAIAVDLPGTIAQGAAVIVHGMLVRAARIGAPGSVVRTVRRQRSMLRIVVWAASPSDRTVIARAVDSAMSLNLRVNMPDGTQCLIRYGGTLPNIDAHEKSGEFRRDLIYSAQYDTTVEYVAYEITAVGLQISQANQ